MEGKKKSVNLYSSSSNSVLDNIKIKAICFSVQKNRPLLIE